MASFKNNMITFFENKKVHLLLGILAISLFIILLLFIVSKASEPKMIFIKEGMTVDDMKYSNPIDPNAPVPKFDISKTQEEQVNVVVEDPVIETSKNTNPTLLEKTLNKEIYGSDIPKDQKDLYILKSEIVPPVCPECPNPVVPRETPCPPCPPCGRCPPNAYDCKKVPNYNAIDSKYVPRAVLNDYSNF